MVPPKYCCRKAMFSIPVQAVVVSSYKFTYMSARCAGSMHDSIAFAVSTFYSKVDNGELCAGYCIVGDAAYECRNGIVTQWSKAQFSWNMMVRREMGLISTKSPSECITNRPLVLFSIDFVFFGDLCVLICAAFLVSYRHACVFTIFALIERLGNISPLLHQLAKYYEQNDLKVVAYSIKYQQQRPRIPRKAYRPICIIYSRRITTSPEKQRIRLAYFP